MLARRTDATFKEVSATSSGTTDVRKLMEDAKKLHVLVLKKTIVGSHRKTTLFLDEIHRFNGAQQV